MAGLATSTKRVYATGYKRYTTFCDCTQLAPFPASESTLQLFVSYLHQEGLSFGTIKSYLAAIRFEQIAQNLGNPNIHLMSHLEYVLKGIKHSTTIHVSPHHTRNTPQSASNLAIAPQQTKCETVVGSLQPMLLWLPTLWGSCSTLPS